MSTESLSHGTRVEAGDDGALPPVTDAERAIVGSQLGRPPRAIRAVAHRCTCGLPDVVETNSRLEDGSPFPTLFYLTCPRAASAIGRLESSGLMSEMTDRIKVDAELAAAHQRSHEDYLRRRDVHGELPGNPGAGGMPTRVKCLHVLVGHSLAVGEGIDVLGDEALAMLPDWGSRGPCVPPELP